MRKSLLTLLIALLAPVFAMAQTNQGVTKTARTASTTDTDEERLYVSPAVLAPVPAAGTNVDAASHSVAAWVKLDATTVSVNTLDNNQVIFGYGGREHCNTNGCWYIAMNKDGNLAFTGWGGFPTLTAAADQPTITAGEYFHLLVSYEASTKLVSVYVNGKLYGSGTASKTLQWFGDEYPAFQFAGFQFGGAIDEIQFFNKALDKEEAVVAMYTAQTLPSAVAIYSLDEVAEGTTGQFAPTYGTTTEKVIKETCTGSASGAVWSNGVVGLIDGITVDDTTYKGTCAESAPTLAEGRTIVEESEFPNVTVKFNTPENGTLVVKQGETTVELDTEHTYRLGTLFSFTATPADDYALHAIKVKDLNGTEYFGTAPNGGLRACGLDTEYDAVFMQGTYVLTVENAMNVPYTLTYEGGNADLANMVSEADYTLTLTVPDNVKLNGVTLNGAALTANGDGTYTINSVVNSTLVIDAVEKAQYTVTYEQPANGTIAVTAGTTTVASGSTVTEGTVLTITATPADGYMLSTLTANGTALSSGSTYTVTAATTIAATFQERPAGIDHCVPAPISGRLYTDNNTKNNTRYLTKATVTVGSNSVEISNSGTYANSVFGTFSAITGRKVYDETATIPEVQAEAGQTVTLKIEGDGTWMNTFVYFDAELDGLDSDDEVARVFSESNGMSVAQESLTFTIPSTAKAGTYRMRYLLNWDQNQGPCEYGQAPTGSGSNYRANDNGDAIFDVDFVIPSAEFDQARDITVVTENAAYGVVAITDPATEGNTVNTKQADVTVAATASEGYTFMNWTNAAGTVVSTDATYTYSGEEAVVLTAHFGHSVAYTVSAGGTLAVSTGATTVASGDVLAVGSEITLTFTPAEGKRIASFTVNGEDKTSEISDNAYTFTLDANTVIAVTYDDFTATITWVVRGNGTVTAGYAWNDNATGCTDNFASGDMINSVLFNQEGLTFWLIPGKQTNSDDFDDVESATSQAGEADPEDIQGELNTDGGPDGSGITEEGGPIYYYTISTLPSEDLTLVFAFTQNGTSSAIDDIFGDEEPDAPAEYYNVNGVRVSGDNLTPGIYVVKKGSKTAKVIVM